MTNQPEGAIASVKLPEALIDRLRPFSDYFPDRVRWDPSDKTIHITEEMPFEMKVSMRFANFAGDVGDVVDNLNLVIEDLQGLPNKVVSSRTEASRRYFFATRVFFYELLRIRDAFPRFLKQLEALGLMSKDERRESRKELDELLGELYLIRNVFLHADSFPLTDDEFDLSFIATADASGYDVKPLAGVAKLPFPELLEKLCLWRRGTLINVASKVIALCQSIIDAMGEWIVAKHFSKAGT